MFKINTEYRKGILFIRLVGRIDNECYLEDINKLIHNFGIRYIVLNLSDLKDVSLDSIKHIMQYHNKMLKKKKQLFICDASNMRNRIFKNKIPNIQCETEAFSLI